MECQLVVGVHLMQAVCSSNWGMVFTQHPWSTLNAELVS